MVAVVAGYVMLPLNEESVVALSLAVENKGIIATPSWCRFLIPPISFRVQWRTTFPGFLS